MSGFGGSSLAPLKKNSGATKIGTDSGQNLQAVLDLLATLASPTFTGTPVGPTAAPGTDTTQFATTAFVQAALAALVDSSPAALDTLNELAAALGDDANFATTMTNALALKAALASPVFTGTPTAPTPAESDDSLKLATTAYVDRAAATVAAGVATPYAQLISSAVASNDSAIEFSLSGSFDEYILSIINMDTSSGSSIAPWLRISDDAGVSFDSGASDYEWQYWYAGTHNTDTADAQIKLAQSHNSNFPLSLTLHIVDPHDVAQKTRFYWLGERVDASNSGAGVRATAQADDTVQVKWETGNILTGKFALYGVNRS